MWSFSLKTISMDKIPFEQLDKQAQKLRIVSDAIEQINLGLIIAATGDYFTMSRRISDIDYEEVNLQTLLKNGKRCSCCAKGALFASCVLNVNEVYTNRDHFNQEYFQKKKLLPWFPALELDMIEAAFEQGVIHDTTGKLEYTDESDVRKVTPLTDLCIRFGKLYRNADERMLAILDNILENGEFKPELITQNTN
jgi:hypothetical protein